MAIGRAKPDRRGHPVPPLSAITAIQRARFLKVYEETLDEPEARARAQVTVAELRRLRAEDPDFDAALRGLETRILEEDLEVVRRRLIDAAKKGDVGAAKFVLSKLRRDEFGDQAGVTINITADDTRGKTLEELREMRDRLAKGGGR
jgi:hypothetical protein